MAPDKVRLVIHVYVIDNLVLLELGHGIIEYIQNKINLTIVGSVSLVNILACNS